MILSNSNILITGGTGSFGNTFVPVTLEKYNPKRIVIYSRDKMKQWEMAQKFEGHPRLRFFIGDVRVKDRLVRASDGIDFVVSCERISKYDFGMAISEIFSLNKSLIKKNG